jgi:hypothetical protein
MLLMALSTNVVFKTVAVLQKDPVTFAQEISGLSLPSWPAVGQFKPGDVILTQGF